jgi:hypothetical protein
MQVGHLADPLEIRWKFRAVMPNRGCLDPIHVVLRFHHRAAVAIPTRVSSNPKELGYGKRRRGRRPMG